MSGGMTWKTAEQFAVCAASSAMLVAAVIAAYGQDNNPDQAKVSAALGAWDRIVTVLQHPRCLNCHQQTTPLQGDERRIHIPLAVRGPDGHGVGAMRCGNCHNPSGNSESSGVPGGGGPGAWQLAPVAMMWQGLSSSELCQMLKDPARNKDPVTNQGRDGPGLIAHVNSALVIWAWNPGGDREPIPMAHDDFINQMKIWVAGGMACPR